MTHTDKRLIEEFIPIKQISAEASREKSIRHGHISTLHLWWARRPLVASRAAVFAALVPADAKPQVKAAESDPEPMSLNRFMIELCKWNVAPEIIEEARRLIREAYPDAPPKVLDMFAGGGAIPLEALRLGCEAYALDLNPVAHIIELATLVYPQKYGPKLAEDVRKWGEWVLERVRAEVGDLYPLIPDPEFTPEHAEARASMLTQPRLMPPTDGEQMSFDDAETDEGGEEALDNTTADVPFGYLQPVAYLWTRTVTCPNPACRATVPLVRQTWLKKKKGDNVALEMKPHPTENRMAFHVRHARDPQDFGFDPAGFSQRGNSVCYRCGTTVTSDTVKAEGKAGRMGAQMMATVCIDPTSRRKRYLSPDDVFINIPNEPVIKTQIDGLSGEYGIRPPMEPLVGKAADQMPAYGMSLYANLFSARQLFTMLSFVKNARLAHEQMELANYEPEYARAVSVFLAIVVDKMALRHNTMCTWATTSAGGRLTQAFGRQALAMVWDYAEANPLSGASGDFLLAVEDTLRNVTSLAAIGSAQGKVERGSAEALPYSSGTFDAIVTDPPYYDYMNYSDISDFFYVWLKQTIGHLFPAHFSTDLAPKKKEAIASPYRHDSPHTAAKFYEHKMNEAFQEAYRVLRRDAPLVVVYAHKTTAGWATLVESLKNAGFAVTEAWPLDTELAGHLKKDTAALASSIFLVARKRNEDEKGLSLDFSNLGSDTRLVECADYVNEVRPEMQRIVKERVRFFLQVGVSGADLSIATVGAALAPYTRYACVQLPNGEQLSVLDYLDEVQREVILVLLGEAAKSDERTQYYLMARNNYGSAWVEFDEANNLARTIGVELDTGPDALTRGADALVEKKGSKIRLLGFEERGERDTLGLPRPERPKAPLIDVLHRLLWLVEHDNAAIQDFLAQTMPEKYILRVVAQSLQGKALASEPKPGAMLDERTAEQRAIQTLLASWRRIVDEGKML